MLKLLGKLTEHYVTILRQMSPLCLHYVTILRQMSSLCLHYVTNTSRDLEDHRVHKRESFERLQLDRILCEVPRFGTVACSWLAIVELD